MKLIIEIDDYDLEWIQNGYYIPSELNTKMVKMILSGIPLKDIMSEIEQAADKQFQIAMGVADLNERYTHIKMENAYRHSLNIIDKYKNEVN